MALQQTTPAEIPVGPPVRPRGILANAAPAPEGWELGGIKAQELCPTIRIEDRCITLEPRTATRPSTVEFPAFIIEQSSGCSTLSAGDREREAREALDSATDYALGVALAGDGMDPGTPSLADATELGEFASVKAALSALEGAASRQGKGQLYVIHATPSASAYLNGDTVTPSGAALIVSAGYEAEDGVLRLWATGRVWASVGSITTVDTVGRRINNREAWATRSAVVGFNSCINLTATFRPPTATTP